MATQYQAIPPIPGTKEGQTFVALNDLRKNLLTQEREALKFEKILLETQERKAKELTACPFIPPEPHELFGPGSRY